MSDRLFAVSTRFLDVYEKPETEFVAGFIGSPAMNFFDAALSQDGGEISLPGGGSLKLSDGGVPEYAGREIKLGIRPEHLKVVESEKGAIQLRVNHVEALGADTLVHGRLGEHGSFLTLRVSDVCRFKKNTVIPLEVSAKNLHLFDKEKGFRLGI